MATAGFRIPFILVPLFLVGCSNQTQPKILTEKTEPQLTVYEPRHIAEPANETQTGRYSYVKTGAESTQLDPLRAVIDVRLPLDVLTVEEAADYLLKRSGYCLMPPNPGDRAVSHLLQQHLPDVHRHLGPMTLREALLTLGGKAYRLIVDDVYREIGYQVSPAFAGGGRT